MNSVQQRTILFLSVLLYISPFAALSNKSDFFGIPARYFFRDSSSNYDQHIQSISDRLGVDYRLVKALIRAESQFDHMAISPRGAMGLMQLMPGTAKDMGVHNPFNPKENIEGGVRYLKFLLKRFNNDITLALAAYNAGPEAVKRHRGVPPFRETRGYLRKVMGFYSEYKEKT